MSYLSPDRLQSTFSTSTGFGAYLDFRFSSIGFIWATPLFAWRSCGIPTSFAPMTEPG